MTVSEREFQASPEQVFDALLDAERYPRWLVGAKVVRADKNWPAPGSSFRHRVGFGPIEVSDRTTVRAVDAGKRLRLLVRARPFLQANVDFQVSAAGTGTKLRLDETPRGPFRLLTPFIAPLVRARNDRSLHRLAEVVDGSS